MLSHTLELLYKILYMKITNVPISMAESSNVLIAVVYTLY